MRVHFLGLGVLILSMLLLVESVARATLAEQTGTLTTPVAVSYAGFRVTGYTRATLGGGPLLFTVQHCSVGCATANPVMVEGTETYFKVGVLAPAAGAGLRTGVSGYAVTIGGRAAACSQRPVDFRQHLIDASNAGAGDIIERALKQIAITCLGGT